MLTGTAIHDAVRRGKIVIDPFDPNELCANSYAFHLNNELLHYIPPADGVLDPHTDTPAASMAIPDSGYRLRPGVLYLAATRETMGSSCHAATLHACRSVSALGLRIQLSAPLGHCGAVIPWTLELRAAMVVRVYPGMTIGKIAFWPMHGHPEPYRGRYADSGGVIRSLLAARAPAPESPEVIASAGTEPALFPVDHAPQREAAQR